MNIKYIKKTKGYAFYAQDTLGSAGAVVKHPRGGWVAHIRNDLVHARTRAEACEKCVGVHKGYTC